MELSYLNTGNDAAPEELHRGRLVNVLIFAIKLMFCQGAY